MCTCTMSAEELSHMVHLIDWAGNYTYPGFWADWDGEQVHFGGAWHNVPDMLTTEEEPVTAMVQQHAVAHGGLCWQCHTGH